MLRKLEPHQVIVVVVAVVHFEFYYKNLTDHVVVVVDLVIVHSPFGYLLFVFLKLLSDVYIFCSKKKQLDKYIFTMFSDVTE